ncbi:MAG TPA: NAD(P)/FAD-dependent oxidoreductase [Vicinamibacterales bacterium]|nr:NAD(P)/FAD-dependent oxidoreductase [Vicinamibacterales bacterium]
MPDFDVLVVGGGPAGLYAAERLARRGVTTLLCEEHDLVGDPVHCTGVLATESFDLLGLPREATLNSLTVARFVSPSGIAITHATPSPLAAVIDRGMFDRALATRAQSAGAELRLRTRVSVIENGPAAVRAQVGDEWVSARLLLLACGANYTFQRRVGLGLPRDYLHSAQRELPAASPGDVELHFGRDVAPDGFAWAVPVVRPSGTFVRIGVMTSRDPVGCYSRMLERVADRLGVEGCPQPPRQKILPLGAIDRTYADRTLVVGDAAGMVKPTTGGGIHYSIWSAALAADVAIDALSADRLDAAALASYERQWRDRLGEEFAEQRSLRDLVTRLNDQEIDSLFELARTDGVMPIVRKTAQFNHHRHLIRALLRHPPARKILFRSVFG